MAELERLNPTLHLQMRVSRMLGFGFALSLTGVGGLGPLTALCIGLRARKLIRQSGGRVVGSGMAWWCIIVGALGTLLFLPDTVWLFIKAASA